MTGAQPIAAAGSTLVALSAMMGAANIGVVPVDLLEGFRLSYGVEGSEQGTLDPLVRLRHLPLEIDSVPGLWPSACENATSSPVELSRDCIEAGDLFKRWSALQEDANRVAGLEPRDIKVQSLICQPDFRKALISQAMGRATGGGAERAEVAKRYWGAAKAAHREKDFTSAAMIWERAMTNSAPIEPEKWIVRYRAFAAKDWFRSLPEAGFHYDPYSLRLARGAFLAFSSDAQLYRMFLLRKAGFNQSYGETLVGNEYRFLDAGDDRLRIAYSTLSDEPSNLRSIGFAARMIVSAADLYRRAMDHRIDVQDLIELSRKLDESATVG